MSSRWSWLLLLLLSPTALAGDQLVLHSGEVITGELLESRQGRFWIELEDGTVRSVPFEEVDRTVLAEEVVPVTRLDAGWGAPPPAELPRRFHFPHGAKVLVLPFRDHRSEDPRDRDGTGRATQVAVEQALGEVVGLEVSERPGLPGDYALGLSRAQAAALAREAGADFAVYGDCVEFYRVAPMTFRTDRAGMDLEIVRADGTPVYRFTRSRDAGTNLNEPEDGLLRLARTVARKTAP